MTNFLNKLDQSLFLWMNGMHASFLDRPMVLLSGQLLWVPFIAFVLWRGGKLLDRRNFFIFMVFLAVTLVLSDVTSSYIMKNVVNRLRPCRVPELKPLIYHFGQKCGGKFGFVSSHAANSLALVLYFLRALKPEKKFYALLGLPLLVGFSRIYLGVHYPGDILGGFLIGSALSVLMAWLFIQARGQAGSVPRNRP